MISSDHRRTGQCTGKIIGVFQVWNCSVRSLIYVSLSTKPILQIPTGIWWELMRVVVDYDTYANILVGDSRVLVRAWTPDLSPVVTVTSGTSVEEEAISET